MTQGAPSNDRLKAAGNAVLGMAMMGFIDNFVTLIAQDIGLWQFHLVRSAMVLVLLLPLAAWMGWRWRPVRPGAVAVRSAFMASAMVLYFGALAILPIAEVAAGLFTAPIFVLLISRALGAPIGPAQVAAVALGFAGVLILLRPGTSFQAVSLIPVLAGFLYACGAVATRRLCAGEATSALLFGFFLCLGLWGAGGLIWLAGTPTALESDGFFGTGWRHIWGPVWGLVAAQAVVSLLAIGLIFRAYQLAEATHVSIFEYSFLIWSSLWAFLIWEVAPTPDAALGIALILCAGVVILWRSGQREARV